jgi:hypothetical protein
MLRIGITIASIVLAMCVSLFAQDHDTDVTINKRPFVDLGPLVNDQLDRKKLDLEVPFLVAGSGTLDRDGKLDASTFKFTRAESQSREMLDVVKAGVLALNNSGYFQYLSMMGISQIRIQLEQNDKVFNGSLEGEVQNELRAKTLATMLRGFINVKKDPQGRYGENAADDDERFLLEHTTAEPIGKVLRLVVEVPKPEFKKMVERKLAEQKPAQQNP